MRIASRLLALLIVGWLAHSAAALELRSPDGNLTLTVELTPIGQPCYRLSYRHQPILAPSRLGLELQDGKRLAEGFAIGSTAIASHDTTWKPVYGERSEVRDRYNQLVVSLQNPRDSSCKLELTFRAYNEGVAFCYTIPEQPTVKELQIAREQSEFRFLGDHQAWAVYTAQGIYKQAPLSAIKPGCERPMTVQVGPETYVALGEARLVDYARMKFAPLAGVPHALVSDLSGPVKATLPLRTPWRFVMVAQSPGQLLENNDLLLNLNDPCAIADASWIKPGKVIREVSLTTVGGKACVDFAVKHNLQYVEFDAGWYGHEYSDESDATTVTLDPKRSRGPLDLPEVIRYAEERGIGIILYVNRRALERQLDVILPLYRQWGIKGVKYGFVNVGSQQWTTWLHDAVRKAAEHQLMVDIHDEYRPTGYSRTYPNLMTQEGIGGDETSPTNDQTLMILFNRMLAGAADNTICYYDGRVKRNATHAYQLAKAVCFYSPWQFLYWYDRPSIIGDEPELEFFDHVPTVWDDTKVLHGQIGQYAAIARRSGDAWCLGCMNHGEARTLDLPLSFLAKDKKYVAHIYSDDPTVATRTHVRIDRRPVDAATVLKATLSAQGGQAVRIVPTD